MGVPGQQHEMGVLRWGPGWLGLDCPRSEGEVGLEAQDGADPLFPGLIIERSGGVQVAVVGDGEGVHPERLDVLDQLGEPVGSVEQGVLAVGVEMSERHESVENRIPIHRDCQKSLPCLGLRRFHFAPPEPVVCAS